MMGQQNEKQGLVQMTQGNGSQMNSKAVQQTLFSKEICANDLNQIAAQSAVRPVQQTVF